MPYEMINSDCMVFIYMEKEMETIIKYLPDGRILIELKPIEKKD